MVARLAARSSALPRRTMRRWRTACRTWRSASAPLARGRSDLSCILGADTSRGGWSLHRSARHRRALSVASPSAGGIDIGSRCHGRGSPPLVFFLSSLALAARAAFLQLHFLRCLSSCACLCILSGAPSFIVPLLFLPAFLRPARASWATAHGESDSCRPFACPQFVKHVFRRSTRRRPHL